MSDNEPNSISAEELAPPTTFPKTLSWSRNLRTSCDLCKQMKIKCQRNNNESCARCVTRKLNCTTTPVERKRQKLTNKRDVYFDEMEDRIKRMESAIITSGLHGTTEPIEGKEEERDSSEKIESQARLTNHLSNLVIDANGSSNFIGWASGFSIFSPQGFRWISEKVGNKDELAELVRKMSKRDYGAWGSGGADLWSPTPRSQHSPLPSKDLALQYINCFFTTLNNVFPVVNREVFNSYFERQYSPTPPTSTAWYALFNAVLCLGNIKTKDEPEKHVKNSYLIDYTSITQETGAEYFRNASSCFHDLFFKEANLMAMQAMTLMTFITTSSPNPQPAYVMASAAGNLANTLGLHRSLDGFGHAPEMVEQRRNVFWVFYLLEKTISHNLGRPSVINDDDIAVDLPPRKPVLIQSHSGAKVYDVFRNQIMLAIIKSRIYSELYSASSQTKSEVDRMKVLGQLDDHLQRWRDAIPVDIRPEHPIKCSDEQYIPVVMMHFTYLDAVIRLHRLSSHQESFKKGKATDLKSHDQRAQPNPRVYASHLLCLAAARRTIQLLDTFSSSNNMQSQRLMWLALYYPLSASLVLFANILSNPQDQNAASDIHLINLITSFMNRSIQPGTSFSATPTLSMFQELYKIATRLVAKLSSQSSQNMKRPPENDNPEQSDFASSTTYSETDIPNQYLPMTSGLQISQGDQDVQDTTSARRSSQESTGNDFIEFAPFIPFEPSQFAYDPITYDSLISPTKFDWDMANFWTPSFELDLGASGDLIGLPDFNENSDGNNTYQ